MMESNGYILVLTTCPSAAEAARLAAKLVERGLAACVQWHAIQSTYRWQGAVEVAEEVRLLVKARRADYAEIEAAIRAGHSYETPQVIAIPIAAGSKAYLAWLEEETRRD